MVASDRSESEHRVSNSLPEGVPFLGVTQCFLNVFKILFLSTVWSSSMISVLSSSVLRLWPPCKLIFRTSAFKYSSLGSLPKNQG